MSATEIRPAFRQRLNAVTWQIWSLQVVRGVARTLIAAIVLLAAVAAADYFWELPWAARTGITVLWASLVAILAMRWIARPAMTWDRPRVAVELEGLFPRLGQRLRTALQHGPRSSAELAREGVAPALVAALEEETAEKTRPLPLQAALPVRPAIVVATAALGCVALLTLAVARNPEFQLSLRRMTLAPVPYTSITATSSETTVNEGADVDVRAHVSGRPRSAVILHVREAGAVDWRQETMDAVDEGFSVRLSRLRNTTEYFVAAGPDRTPVQQIVVQHPLKIVATRVEVAAPSYTGVPLAKHDSGSFSAVQGSRASFQFEFDRSPEAASLIVKNPARPSEPARRIDMTVHDRSVAVDLSLTNDMEYSIEACDTAGVPAGPNRNRVRVVADQPPSVSFDEPSESLEVHTLAEVVMKARARDDFGITKLGIVFQVNNEEERTLVIQDISQPFQREARAEQLMMLEQFLLTQKDCVAYYAFAEDNRPGTPQRTTTELRFIDIRPFQRVYQLIDRPDAPPGPQRDLIFLDEVIARQRFNLNQSIRLETRSRARIDVAQVDKIAAFENKLATQTHDLADFLAGLGVDGVALLSQAEETMLSAVDSLQNAKFTTAISQERDALRYLMEARNTVQNALEKKPRAARAQARAFDRLQRQKLRRQNEKAETLPEIASELNRLADDEDEIARNITLSSSATSGTPGMGDGQPDPSGDSAAKPMDSKPMDANESGSNATDPPMPSPTGNGAAKKDNRKTGKESEDPLQERQDDLAARATIIDKAAAGAKGLTALAKTRITDAAKAANAGADALGQRDRKTARNEADRARELFRLAAKQVAALAAEEAAQQIAAARDMANEIAAQTAPEPEPKGTGKATGSPMAGFGDASEQAKTLKDVLEQLAGSGSEDAADAARKVGAMLKQEDLAAAIARLEKQGAGNDRGERQDLSERFAALGQKLDQAYRETVAPRLEELAKLEQEAHDLEQRAQGTDDAADLRRMKQQAASFVDRLESARLGDLAGDDLRAALRGSGNNSGSEALSRSLAGVHSRLVAKLQQFVAGDHFATGNEAVPPQYKDLVERYLRALAAGSTK